jgi:hypothetical protein
MEAANEFDDQESLAIPANHLLAIVPDSDEARGVVEALNRNGFSPDEIGVLTGPEEAEKLAAATGKKGFFVKMLTSGVEMGDRDTEYFEQYRKALLDGRTAVGVVAKNDETRNNVRQILKAHGAYFITFFGQFVTEVLEA